ncbi:hypothetical protein HY636_05375 [Candidatus Woesearchaeota archaeon]|nr:hypothetical protein [Candidatus Woesearchaeota archaeon]
MPKQKQVFIYFFLILLAIIIIIIIGSIFYFTLKSNVKITESSSPPSITGFATAVTSATVTNSLPSASSVSMSAGAATETVGLARTAERLTCAATITDLNGCVEVNPVSGLFYRTNLANPESGLAGALNWSNRYQNGTCVADAADTCTGGTDTTVAYNCTFTVQSFVDPTDAGPFSGTTWTCNITGSDQAGAGTSGTDTIEIAQALNLEFNTSIAFGSLALGATKENVTTKLNNSGNNKFDLAVSGYGVSVKDHLSFNCTPTGNLSNTSLEYMFKNQFVYGASGNNLSDDDVTNSTLNLEKLDFVSQTTTTAINTKSLNYPNETIYWGLLIPANGVGGTCTGTVVLTTAADNAAT